MKSRTGIRRLTDTCALPAPKGCRHRIAGRSEISCNEIALSTELTLAREGWRGGIRQPTDSSADLPQLEQRYDVSRREHEVKSRTGTPNTRTCALPAGIRHCGVIYSRCQSIRAIARKGQFQMKTKSGKEYLADIPFLLTLIFACYALVKNYRPLPSSAPELEWSILAILTAFMFSEYVKNYALTGKVIALNQPATLDVQADRRSNYESGAKILSRAGRTDTVILSFLEHSSMWTRPTQKEDKVFDDALQYAIKVGQCTVHHVIRCDNEADLLLIADYIKQFTNDQNYFAYLMTEIYADFPPIDLLVVSENVAQLEFPQHDAQPSLMGPSVEFIQPQAVRIMESYARILITKSKLIKDANGLNQAKISSIRGALSKRQTYAAMTPEGRLANDPGDPNRG